MPEHPSPENYQATVHTALSTLDDAGRTDPRDVWRALGGGGAIEALYRPGPTLDPDPARLDALLRTLDAGCPLGVTLSVCVQVATVIPLLAAAGERTVLRGLLDGECVVALAVTDASGSGSDLLDAGTTAKLTDDAVALDGGKDWITNATRCDHALVLARHREARHFTSFCWVLAPVPCEGLSVHPAASAVFRGAGVGHLRLHGVHLAADRVLGRPGRAMAEFARRIGTERLAGALWSRALCRRLLADLHAFLRARPAHGGTLWDNAAIRERFARCLLALGQLDAVVGQWLRPDAGPVDAAAGMLLKATAGDTVEQVLAACVHLRGADAFRDGGEAHLRTEAAMFSIAGGTTGAMLAGLADHAGDLLDAGRCPP